MPNLLKENESLMAKSQEWFKRWQQSNEDFAKLAEAFGKEKNKNESLRAINDELLEALQETSEVLELILSKMGCQTQSAALKSDAEIFGGLKALDNARAAIEKATN